MRPIRNCLNKQLSDLCQRSVQLEELSDKVSLMLPPELAPICQVGSFNKGCLVLNTTDATWASQLRYALPDLRDKLRKEAGMYQLSSIKVMVTGPLPSKQTRKAELPITLSEKAKASIISESEHCTYQPLKKALLNLAD